MARATRSGDELWVKIIDIDLQRRRSRGPLNDGGAVYALAIMVPAEAEATEPSMIAAGCRDQSARTQHLG